MRPSPALTLILALATPLPFAGGAVARDPRPRPPAATEIRTLDGSGNNRAHPTWGQAGMPYRRVASTAYADGVGSQAGGPNARYVSNRVFSDLGQNIFSERAVSQWVWTWGQFMDHTLGLAQDSSDSAPIAFSSSDPLERFRNDFGVVPFKRDAAASGTGTSAANPRKQVNTVSSFIDGWSVYGGTAQRLEWLRKGPVNGNLADNSAKLLMSHGYLPRATARGDSASAPQMAVDGQLTGHPQDAVEAGDVRANENLALTAVHTLFAREHNRIVAALPNTVTDEQKFQIARRVIGAEQQYITYNEFLPAVGVRLDPYRGYNPNVDPSLGNEFATVAYRAHSMIHGEFEIDVPASRVGAGKLAKLEAMGVEVKKSGGDLELTVPLSLAFFNPDLVSTIGLGPILEALGGESQYRNDEQIDDALRSVLFQVPGPTVTDPSRCFTDPSTPGCYQGVVDLGALDIQRGRDHGIPSYNALRRAFGLAPKTSFTSITGEATDQFPADPEVDSLHPIDDPDILDFVSLRDIHGNPVAPGSDEAQETATSGVRRTTLAARLKAIYGSVDRVDAFVGMVSEAHVAGSEFGPLQLAIWRQQFSALRDGDRFFYANDPLLEQIRRATGITFRHSLADLIARNTGVARKDLPADVFRAG